MKPLRLLLGCCATLAVGRALAAPPAPPPPAACLAAAPLALYTPGAPGTFGVPMVVPVFSAAPGGSVVPGEPLTDGAPSDPPGEDADAGTGSAALFSPSMFGALFGRPTDPGTQTTTTPGTLNGKPATVIFAPVTANGPPTTTARGNASTNVSLSGILGNFTLPLSPQLRTQVQGLSQTVTGRSAPLSTANRNLINGILQSTTPFANPTTTTIPGNGTIRAGQQITIAGLIQNDILSIERQANPQVASVTGSVALTGAAGTFIPAPSQLQYPIAITSLVNIPHVFVSVPTPTGGGVVGQTRISDDNSPLPRDRVLFNYDYFNGTALTRSGVDVHRMEAGFEKTFFDGWTSIEMRLPFASSLSSYIASDGAGNSRRTEFGDLSLIFKSLIYRCEVFNAAAGLGIDVPTAESTHVSSGGTELLRIDNDAVVLTPFLAWLLTPNDSLFMQNWCAIAFTSQGNRVSSNINLTGLQVVGRLYDQSQAQIDAQMGYWLVHPGDGDGPVTGLAPFVELHYDASLGKAGNLRTSGVTLGASNGNFNELDLSLGAVVQLGGRANLSAGATFPLLGATGRTFDYEVGIRCNIFFGSTYSARTAALSTAE